MPCALTCAGVGAAAGDGEAFSVPRAVARAVAVEPLPAPLAALSRNEARDAAKWLAWADRMHEQGLPLNWQTAQDAGIVSSTSTAKRRLRVYRQAYPDRF